MNTSEAQLFEYTKFTLHRIKFVILLMLYVPALILSILIVLFFLKNRAVRKTLYQRALLILISINLVQLMSTLPLDLLFYSNGYVNPATSVYCTWWVYFEFTFFTVNDLLVAIIAIQRHMLIFNAHLFRVPWKCFLFHDFPLLFSVIYSFILYTFLILLYPCDGSQWDYTSNLCGFCPCYLLHKTLGTFDWIAHNATPLSVNALSNALLLVRVVKHKRRQQRSFTWKQQRRMTVQLFCISLLYIIAWMPSLIAGLGQILVYPTFLAQLQTDYFLDLIYSICLIMPWVCLGLLPEFVTWLKKMYPCGQANVAVAPETQTRGLTHQRTELH